jgi:hypothetical protein
METIGWLMILSGAVLIRSVAVGRVPEITSDVRTIFVGILTGDIASVKATTALRGSGLSGAAVTDTTSSVMATDSGKGSALLTEMIKLGSASSGRYVWGTSGPTTYDCSGMVWRAMRDIGMYTGARFTTRTFPKSITGIMAQVSTGYRGDIVLWPGHHMGVVVDGDRFYGAQSIKTGIGYASVRSTTKDIGVQAQFWTLMNLSGGTARAS